MITAAGFTLMCLINATFMPVPYNDLIQDLDYSYTLHWTIGQEGWGDAEYILIEQNRNEIVGACEWKPRPNLMCQAYRNDKIGEIHESDCSEIQPLGHFAIRCKTDRIGMGKEERVTCLQR